MKKLLILIAVCAFTTGFVACGQKTESSNVEESQVDVDSAVDEQPPVYDSAASTVDSTDVAQ
ncbi:MAG TPA: hypothetical protein VD884_00125 [Ohtaekwangia sp.]|nr:hypothetical protein [Ohtaekwangia sp.]